MERVTLQADEKLPCCVRPGLRHHIHHAGRGQLAAPQLHHGLLAGCAGGPRLEQRHANAAAGCPWPRAQDEAVTGGGGGGGGEVGEEARAVVWQAAICSTTCFSGSAPSRSRWQSIRTRAGRGPTPKIQSTLIPKSMTCANGQPTRLSICLMREWLSEHTACITMVARARSLSCSIWARSDTLRQPSRERAAISRLRRLTSHLRSRMRRGAGEGDHQSEQAQLLNPVCNPAATMACC